jgi:hypothetical protein
MAEVALTGVVIVVVSLPIVTAPAAFVAGREHLRRAVFLRDSRVQLAWADFREAFSLGSALIGLATAVLLAATFVDLALLSAGEVLGAGAASVLIASGCVIALTVGTRAACRWSGRRTWRKALSEAIQLLRRDAVGSLLIAIAIGITALLGWQLLPIFPLAVGCLCYATLAIEFRSAAVTPAGVDT